MADKPTLTVVINDAQNLTPREIAVLELLCVGMTRKEIARARHRSYSTVSDHVEAIARKLNARSHAEIVAKAVASGIVRLGLAVLLLLLGYGMLSAVWTVRPPVPIEAVWLRQ